MAFRFVRPGQFLHTGVCDFGAGESQRFQVFQLGQFLQPHIGHVKST